MGLSALLCLLAPALALAALPFRNESLSWGERVDDLVQRLSLEEIMQQMSRGGVGRHGGPAPAIPRLAIMPYSWNTECLRGDVSAGNATSFPQSIGLAAAFSPQLLFNVSEATGIEVRAKFNDYMRHKQYGDHKGVSCFSPVINIMRHPLWGRNQETYGEDPFLSGVYAAQFVAGLQGNHPRYIRANAGCKHFNVHGGPENIPVSRFSFDAKVSDADWHLTFLPAFKSCVKAGSYSLMCSYNRINGVPACANIHLLTDILRKEWGFSGYVISDQGAIENIIVDHHYLNTSVQTVAACVRAGCNLELHNDLKEPVYNSMIDAINSGMLSEAEVREKVKPLFYTRMRLGEFDAPEMNPYSRLNLSLIQTSEHRDLSLRAALNSFVLLKNENNFLPLTKKFSQIAVIGPLANNTNQLFGDYSPDINPRYTTTVLQGLQDSAELVRYAAGCITTKCSNYSSDQVKEAVTGSQLIIVCLGTGQALESEGNDRFSLDLPGSQLQLLEDAVTFGSDAPVVLLLFNAGPLDVAWADSSNSVVAIIECYFPAQATGEAIRRLLFRDGPYSNPAGRLPNTWPRSLSQIPPITNYTMIGRTYRYGQVDPLYPFGYGLSYTSFHYDGINFAPSIVAGQDLPIEVTLTNTGKLGGDEVVQVYISWRNYTESMPKLQLVAFDRLSVPASKTILVQIVVRAEQMAVWENGVGFIIKPGEVDLYVGGQQPNQKRNVGSNVISKSFTITKS